MQLRSIAEEIRDDLLALPEVAQVSYLASRNYQIDIEFPEETLRSMGSRCGVRQVIRRENRELPLVQFEANHRRFYYEEIIAGRKVVKLQKLPLVADSDGAVLTVGDLGRVRDEFADATSLNFINGQPAMALSVQQASQDLFAMIDAVKQFVGHLTA